MTTPYTIAAAIEALRADVGKGFLSWDNFHKFSRDMKRTTYHRNGDRTKWCEGCGCRSRQQGDWDISSPAAERVSLEEAPFGLPIWECGNCCHQTPRRAK